MLVLASITFITLFAANCASLRAQQSPAQQPPLRGTANPYGVARYEINQIRFEGNATFPSEELASVVSSRSSEVTLTRRVSNYVATELNRNPAAPKRLQQALNKIQRDVSSELRYLDKTLAAADTLALVTFYHQNGFHHASAEYDFLPDPETRINTLLFRINEGTRSLVDTVVNYGLNGIAEELLDDVRGAQTLRRGVPFTLGELNRQTERIIKVLRNNGYYSAQVRKPIVSTIQRFQDNGDSTSSNVSEADSITVFFSVGTRRRVRHIAYVDSSAQYTALSPSVPQAFVEIHEGDWYNESAVATSLNKLYRFGLFDVAVIDSTSAFVPQTDSTVSLRVLTKTRAIHEFNYGLTTGQDAINGFVAGLEATYFNRNSFGGAETFNPFLQLSVLNINDIFTQGFNSSAARLEGRAGITFSKPVFLSVLGDRRVGLDAKALFSVQQLSLAVPLLLQSFLVQASLPIEWYRHTVINSIAFDLTLDRQSPQNFGRTRSLLVEGTSDSVRKQFFESVLYQYGVLDTLVNNGRQFITNAIISIQARGDKRDNPFTPKTGYVADFAADIGIPTIGISGFVRLQTNLSWYEALDKRLVAAAKLRVGHTFLLNPDVFYVPFDRHFFAGGSNSIRGWGARELRFRREKDVVGAAQFVDQIVGNGSVLEASAELRWSLREQASEYAGFIERQLSRIGVTAFVDVGNAFNSFQNQQDYGRLPFSSALQAMAIAAGAGLRYDTPAGPLRVDVALRVHDPARARPWLFAQPFDVANDVRVQIGLGHAF